jgi:hypothetical protein
MSLPVDVQSLETLREVRAALVEFSDEARGALGTMDMEVRRLLDWLAHDQRMYWLSKIKQRQQELADAKAELHRKKLSAMFGNEAYASEQKDMVRVAKARLEDAEDRLEKLRRWVPQLEHAIGEYRGPAGNLADCVGVGMERNLELLDRMITAIDEYIRMAPPETSAAVRGARAGSASVARGGEAVSGADSRANTDANAVAGTSAADDRAKTEETR